MNDEAETDYRKVLAERIKLSRRRKFKTVDAARMAAEIARGTWEKAEKGEPIKDFSLAAIERALEWEEGYAQSILDGVDPERRQLADRGMDATPRLRPKVFRKGVEAYVLHLEDRIEDLESRVAQLEGGDGDAEDELARRRSAPTSEPDEIAAHDDLEDPPGTSHE